QMVTERPEDLDVIAFSGDELEASFQVFFVRRGRMTGRKGFIVDRVEELSPAELLESFLENLYGEGQEVPREILVPVAPADEELPKKSEYRKFKMRTVEGQDDFASMGELIRRRFTRYLEETAKGVDRTSRFAYRPGLVVIDGGKGQLNRAVEVLAELGLSDIP